MTFAHLFGARLEAVVPPQPIYLTPGGLGQTQYLSFALSFVSVLPIFPNEKVSHTCGRTAKTHFILADKAIIQLFFGSFD